MTELRKLRWPILVFLVLLPAVPAGAQAVYGSIAGTVSDPSGAALPGVTVTITSIERSTSDTRRLQRLRPLRQGAPAPRRRTR